MWLGAAFVGAGSRGGFSNDLGLSHVGVLSKLDTASVAATAQVVESRNVARDDVAGACLDRAEVLAGAPQAQGAFFRVPRIIAGVE